MLGLFALPPCGTVDHAHADADGTKRDMLAAGASDTAEPSPSVPETIATRPKPFLAFLPWQWHGRRVSMSESDPFVLLQK